VNGLSELLQSSSRGALGRAEIQEAEDMDPWYKVATPRKEVREGRSFNPDEFAIALEQVVAGNAPEDYRDPEKFFSRTCLDSSFLGRTSSSS